MHLFKKRKIKFSKLYIMLTGAGEIRWNPERTTMLEQNSSFKVAPEVATRSSIGIPAKSSEHGMFLNI